MIALAAEKGFTLTEEDLKPALQTGEVSDAELDAVAGGKTCACVAGGGGEANGDDGLCWCVFTGIGMSADKCNVRCYCWAGGGGTNWNP